MSNFIPFDEFLKQIEASHYSGLAARADGSVKVQNAKEFQAMRQHVLSHYKGVNVAHSFMDEDGHHIDCIPVDQQPGLLRRGVNIRAN